MAADTLYRVTMIRAAPGQRIALKASIETQGQAAAGRVTNAVFIGVFGADRDAATIGFHKDWVAYGAPGVLSVEEQEAAARANGFDGLAGIAPYLRTLLVGHNDTFAVPMR